MADLTVQLTADVKDLLKNLELTTKQLEKLGEAADVTQEELDEIGDSGKNAAKETEELGSVLTITNAAMAALGISATALAIEFVKIATRASVSERAIRTLNLAIGQGAIRTNLLATQTKFFNETASASNRTLEERTTALRKLKALQKGYLDNLTLENIQLNENQQLIRDVTNAALRNAQITAIANTIAQLQAKVLEEENKSWQERLDITEALFAGLTNIGRAGGFSAVLQTLTAEGDAAAFAIEKLNQKLLELLEQGLADPAKIVKPTGPTGVGLTQSLPIPGATVLEEIFGVTPEAQSNLEKAASETAARAIRGFDVGFRQNVKILEELGNPLERIFSTQALETVQANITGGLTNLFANIGTAIAEGGNVIGAIGSSLLQGFGRFISDIGQLLIQYGTLAVAKGKLDLAVQKGGLAAITAGGAAIAIGAAAVAVGAALSAAGNRIGDRAQGGFVGGGTFTAGQDFTGGTSPVGGGFTDSRVVFEISGTSLVGVLSRTLNRNQRLGAGIIS